MSQKSHWITTAQSTRLPRILEDVYVDVAVVGGGITGITAAYLLKKAGLKVALVERDRCCQVDTGHTTAHLTYVTDLRLHKLVKSFGRDHAQAAWDAGRAAIETIDAIVREENIDCGFNWVPGYLHSPVEESDESDVADLEEDASLAAELGFDAKFLDAVPLVEQPGIRFANQARFHPLRYLGALLLRIPGSGSHVFEDSEVSEFQEEPFGVRANGHFIDCKYIIIATHVPLMGNKGFLGATLLQTKLASYTSYAIGATLTQQPPDILLWDTAQPYNYLRFDRTDGKEYAIFGGEDHKTGQKSDPEECYRRLTEKLKSILPQATVDSQWCGQVVETSDGLPYIGETAERQFVATGFAGNGMTFGTLAAMMASDAALGRKNPWTDLFAVGRKKLSATWDYVKENLDFPYYFLRDRLAAAEGETLESVKPGEGKILKLNG